MPNIKITMAQNAVNVYRLLGTDENSLSAALGHLMVIDSTFMVEVLKKMGVLPHIRGKSYMEYRKNYTVSLQDQASLGSGGRKDIVIEAGETNRLRVVIEAKIGKGSPDSCQLLRYSIGCYCGNHPKPKSEEMQQMWGASQYKFIVALTRDPLNAQTRVAVSQKLYNSGIKLCAIQWSDVLAVALERLKQDPEILQRIFLQEFVEFFKEYYEMRSYQVEVIGVNP
jgi:hypothetical protein